MILKYVKVFMIQEVIALRNYAHIGDAVWEIFVREYVIFKTSNSKILHKMTTDRVNASYQAEIFQFIEQDLTEEEHEIARRARNLPIPVGRRPIQQVYRKSTALEALVGLWYMHDKERLEYFFNKIKTTEAFID